MRERNLGDPDILREQRYLWQVAERGRRERPASVGALEEESIAFK